MTNSLVRTPWLISVSAIVVAGMLAEGVLRLTGYLPYYLDQEAFVPSLNSREVYELRPGFRGLYAGVPIVVNSHGFRGPEGAAPSDRRVRRIAILGDSIAFGQGVREGETLADRLASVLRTKTGEPISVLNLGVPGFDTCQEYERFVDRGVAWAPRAAVLVYYENDTEGPVFHVEHGTVLSPDVRTGRWGQLAAAARKDSFLYNLVWTRWQVMKAGSFGREAYRQMLLERFSSGNPAWQASKACLTTLAARARAESVRLIVIPFPVLDGLTERQYPFQEYVEAVCAASRDAGAECLDVVPELRDPRIVLRVSTVDQHPSADVYQRLADRLADILP